MNNDQISGVIEKIIFSNKESGFSIFILHCKKMDPVTVTGTFAQILSGQEIHIQGSWCMHPKFGKQFQATAYTTTLPTSTKGIEKYLASGVVKGIGKVYAEKIVSFFGTQTLRIIDENPDMLKGVPGIGEKRIETIKKAWVDQKYIAKIMVFLQEKGVSSNFATKIYKKYGHDAIAKVSQDPYQLTDDVWGIGFKTADQIAANMGFATGSIQRIQAGILFTLKQASNQGHVYQEVEALKTKALQLLELDKALHQTTLKNALVNIYQNDKIKLLTWNNQHFIGLSSLYGSEKGIAQKILHLLQTPTYHHVSSKKIYDTLQKKMHISLNEEQQNAILACFEHKFSIITGGPGTGKTTLIKTLINVLSEHNFSFKLAAPTGRAAKRLMESTKHHACTIHRLLEFNPETMRFIHNETNALQTDFLIIDETSMIDIFLGFNIFKAVSEKTHVLFIGDVDQLPSVGPGAVLKDLIESEKIHCTKLTEIFRQAQNSMIIQNAHKINHGLMPENSIENCKKDFYFINQEEPEQLFSTIKQILFTTIKNHNISLENTTILTPMHRGASGAQKLNYDLQQLLNHSDNSNSVSSMGTTYKINDRVMQITNNYDKKVFNGDIGIITDINQQDEEITVLIDDNAITYSFDELNELVLSYAITIHKSQGSEYEAVIIPIFMQHFMLLERNLIYTAITRAKKLCIFVGQKKAIAIGIKNKRKEPRITFLKQFLSEQLSCRT